MEVSRVFERFWDHCGPTYIALTRYRNKLTRFNGSHVRIRTRLTQSIETRHLKERQRSIFYSDLSQAVQGIGIG